MYFTRFHSRNEMLGGRLSANDEHEKGTAAVHDIMTRTFARLLLFSLVITGLGHHTHLDTRYMYIGR